MVRYNYDAWGNHTVSGSNITLGNLNPIRYRGYYYDTETNLYYLQTRYYDPETGRFISQDSIEYADPESINGLNLYAYCGNNPVMYVDPSGHEWYDVLGWIGLGLVLLSAIVLTAGVGSWGVAGFIIAGAAKGALIGAAVGAVGGAIGGMIYDAYNGNNFGTSIWAGVKAGIGIGAIAGAIIGAGISGVQVANAAKSWASTGAKSAFKQMTDHYARHVIKEGQQAVAKNIVNYTKQASRFFNNNNASGYLLREGVIKIPGAPGGIFNTNGLIRSFWYVLK